MNAYRIEMSIPGGWGTVKHVVVAEDMLDASEQVSRFPEVKKAQTVEITFLGGIK